ncbi:hypothetical protein HKX48_002729 [Thoreauomyces humboldtii]|nr:hypothetical protein HKX48_002729 [Thoreauomyces humboldtii]
MDLKGSCHCGKVTFTCRSHTPYPFCKCYCNLCRKTAGGGGYSINIMADASTLVLEGREHTKVYRANVSDLADPKLSTNHRHFCVHCASFLYAHDPTYPQWIYPFASAIDTELPEVDKDTCIFLESRKKWVVGPREGKDLQFDGYPVDSIEDVHKKNGWWID